MQALSSSGFWGTVPDWLAAIGTIGAFTGSLVVLSRETKERRQAAEFARSAQARQVKFSPSEGADYGWRLPGQGGNVRLYLYNRSDEAVHDVTLTLTLDPGVGTFAGKKPSQDFEWAVLPADREEEINVEVIPAEDWDGGRPGIRPHLQFTDMAGQRWERDHEHRLLLRSDKG